MKEFLKNIFVSIFGDGMESTPIPDENRTIRTECDFIINGGVDVFKEFLPYDKYVWEILDSRISYSSNYGFHKFIYGLCIDGNYNDRRLSIDGELIDYCIYFHRYLNRHNIMDHVSELIFRNLIQYIEIKGRFGTRNVYNSVTNDAKCYEFRTFYSRTVLSIINKPKVDLKFLNDILGLIVHGTRGDTICDDSNHKHATLLYELDFIHSDIYVYSGSMTILNYLIMLCSLSDEDNINIIPDYILLLPKTKPI